MAFLSREAILQRQDVRVEKVEIPEWEGHVFVRMLGAAERDKFEQSNVKVVHDRRGKGRMEPQTGNYRARLAVLCACDEEGKRIFADSDAVDLGRKDGSAVDRIATAAMRLNRMNEEALEDEEKNLENGQTSSSSTD